MTFTFVMDAFPDYTKFDHTRKVFAAIQIIADENIHEEPVDEGIEGGGWLDPAFKFVKINDQGVKTYLPGVVPGYDKETWAKDQIDGDAKGVKYSKLGSYLKCSINRSDIEFTGNLNRIDNWDAFSTTASELTGYYYPLAMYAPAGTVLERTLANGDVKQLTFGSTDDSDVADDDGNVIMTMVCAVHPDAPIMLFKLKNADGDKVTNYTFDFSRVVFK